MPLNDDILLTVFETLTEPIPDIYTPIEESARPLVHVRTASQVCRRWRCLLLASPRIWGRVIDLGGKQLGVGRTEWLDEVMTRAGSSPLWIYGDVIHAPHSSSFDGEIYLVRLLYAWERIEKLSVVFCDQQIPQEIQRCFMTRAPMLKSFKVHHNMYPSETERTAVFREALVPSQSLFANHAPLLVEITAHHFFFKLDSSWLPNIRDLDVSISQRFLTIPMMFTLLQRTPLLESIVMSLSSSSGVAWDPTADPFPALNLPKLTDIRMFLPLTVAATFLDHISPGTLSRLSMGLTRVQQADHHFLADLQNSLRRYMSKHFTTNSSKDLLLSLLPKEFRLSDLTPPQPSASAGQHRVFDLRIILYTSVADDGPFQGPAHLSARTILDVFNLISGWKPSIFQSVVVLRVGITECLSSEELSLMSKTFPHVQHLHINPEFTTSLSMIDSDDPQDSFPKLFCLRIVSDKLRMNDEHLTTPLTRFLTRKRDIGLPVARLDFRYCTFRHAQDLTHLDAFEGMQVGWRQSVGAGKKLQSTCYTCGSGNPERLAISGLEA